MNNNKHTPGPWKIRPTSHEGCGTIRVGRHMSVEISDSSNAEADTRLIAAAPELLYMLKLLYKNRKELPDQFHWQKAGELIDKVKA